MKALFKDKLLFLVVVYLLVVLIAIPLTLFTLNKPTKTQTNASETTSLIYTPSTIQTTNGESGEIVMDDVLNSPTNSPASTVNTSANQIDPTTVALVILLFLPLILLVVHLLV